MDITEYFRIIKRHCLLVIFITLLTALTTAVLSYFFMKPSYKADISVMIGSTSSNRKVASQDYSSILMYQSIVQTYTEIAKTRLVADDARLTKSIDNQYAKSLKKISYEIRRVDNVSLMDEAVMPSSPDSPKPILNIAIAFLLGLIISVVVILLMAYLDNTIKSTEELENLFNLPVLGSIPLISDGEEK